LEFFHFFFYIFSFSPSFLEFAWSPSSSSLSLSFSCVYVSDQASVIIVCKLDNGNREIERGRDERKGQTVGEREKVDRRLSLSSSPLVCLSWVDKFTQFYFLTANMRLIVNARTLFFSKIFLKGLIWVSKWLGKETYRRENEKDTEHICVYICIREFSIVDARRVIVTYRFVINHPYIDYIFNWQWPLWSGW